ncbi:hypothetical protein K458DRAFT_37332 [Lentithecium fluviatile CBS 122367]|uniref:Uncharacterized protein n=1 Tax=Lentithecium fluviatile CBS 122367 TaxID=1168545 RepID=A0A6G1J0Q7_9PLEO|nr:hypothetical protein K458DRAFT_37332 [Lentithecium fluviatile CBS 122367]
MRSFKSKVLSACAWAAPVLSAVLPRTLNEVARPEGKLLDLDIQENYAQATFSVPCAGCLGQEHTSQDDESIILSFKTHADDQPCGTSNVTLNGVYLPQEWNGDFASGSGSYTGVTDFQENAWFLQHDLDLEWESACLHGEQETDYAAQVLTVNIKAIDGKPLHKPSGFTISFKQQSPLELLRLEAVPNHSASDKVHSESWRAPPAHLRLVLLPEDKELKSTSAPSHSVLEDDIRELRALQEEIKKLQHAVAEKQKDIDAQVKQQAQSFKEELQRCDNISCVVKTIAKGAHSAWRVVYVRFRPQHHPHHPPPPPPPPHMGRPNEDPFQEVYRSGYKQVPEGNVGIQSDHPHPPPPPPQHGPPPPPPSHHHHGPPHHGGPRMPPPDSPFVIGLEILLGVLCCGCLVTVIRHRCSSLRTRTERAAAREERRNARAYRRAARKLAWRTWWRGNWRDQERIEDYEEKRSLIQHQESILEDAMQDEIRQLRAAHGVVNDIVQAEEGRGITYGPHVHCHCAHPVPPAPYSPISTASTYPPTSIPEMPSRPLSRTDSLPGYRSDASTSPPAYEEDEDVSDSVPNGFRNYAPSITSSSSSRWTPDSSVIDVSPRPSAETLRYAETTETGVGEKN